MKFVRTMFGEEFSNTESQKRIDDLARAVDATPKPTATLRLIQVLYKQKSIVLNVLLKNQG